MSSKHDDATRLERPSAPPGEQRGYSRFADETMSVNLDHGLVIGEVIGEGGMAVVRHGEQTSLRREVAIKTITSTSDSEGLLREAYVTGVLEHPNIVPIHELVFDEEGRPMLVLKRIEGESWLERMAETGAADADGPDSIERNIQIAISVSRALSFANTRGIVHLDVKPSNVMVGAFGEVYLLDWGLAGSFDPLERFLPAVLDGQRAGTPAYMAPEQWDGTAARIGPWTDVYLLAGSLYHALCGAPPWRRISGGEREGQTGERSIPPELRAILERAMSLAPGERIQSSGAFRLELENYLRQRGSIQLAERATALSRDAVRARAEGDVDGAEYASVEAAVIFGAALSQWPGNERAIRGSLKLSRARIDDALARSLPQVAARLLAALSDPPGDLRRRVDEAITIAKKDASKVRALQHDLDSAVGMDTRVLFIALCGPAWIGGWLLGAVTESMILALSLLSGGTVVWGLGVLGVGREMMSNRLNRVVVFDIFCALCSFIAITATGFAREDTLVSLAPFFIIVHACATAMIASVFDLRLTVLSLVWLLLLPLNLVWPTHGLWLLVGGNVAMVLGIVWVNLRLRRTARAAAKA